MPDDQELPPSLHVDDPLEGDPLEGAPPEDKEVLRQALTELTTILGALPLPEVRDEDMFFLVWKLPDGVIELSGTKGAFCWWTDGALFAEHDARTLNSGYSVEPLPGTPEEFFGGTLVPRFRTWLTRYEELERLRDQILKELKKAGDPREFMRHLVGSVTKKLGSG